MLTDITVFAAAFGVSAFAGLASLLRSQASLTLKGVISTCMNTGVVGLGIALMWHSRFVDNIYLLIGICCFAGFGGSMTIDFVLDTIKSRLSKENKK